MKSLVRCTVFAFIILAGPRPLFSQSPGDTSSTIVTSGLGELTLSPDRVVLMIDVTTRESSAAAATLKNGSLIRRVVDTLGALRGPGDSVELTAIGVHANENYQEGRILGYQATGVIRVVLRRLDQLGHFIDAAFAAGATGIDNLAFHSDREDSAADEAAARAYDRAEKQAQALATAAGVRLGPVMRVSSDFVPSYVNRSTFGSLQLSGIQVGGYGSTPITPEDIRVTASVRVTWQIGRK
jgi:uncharacterized protein YggE